METADMVKVAVSAAPYSIDKPYSYLVPEALSEQGKRRDHTGPVCRTEDPRCESHS